MSYCRWSSDDFSCDLYCYEDVSGGWTTHVAGNRVVGNIPHIDWPMTSSEDFARQYKAQMDFLKTAERKPIGLAYDGQTFNDETLEDFRARIVMLREAGYSCPEYVLKRIDEEIASITYDVIRTDDHGNTFVVQQNLARADADKLCAEMIAKGHKQTYEVKEHDL